MQVLFLNKRGDMATIKSIAGNKSIYVTRPDKGNGIVILDRSQYLDKVNTILSDQTKFCKVDENEAKLLLRLEDKLNNVLRKLKNNKIISNDIYKECFSSGSTISNLYGLPKVHKTNCPIRPILSACNSHNYNLSKHLAKVLFHLSTNEHTVSNSKEFVSSLLLMTLYLITCPKMNL